MTRMSEPLDLTAWMTRWQMFPPPEGLILCAVSGGRDSVCLLDCLWKLGRARDFRVAAAHLNHGMRPTAQRDEDLVRALCAERNIPFYTETVDVYALCAVWRLTVEETGRRARYDFLRRTADALAADFIATAHHRDDQAETVLLQLLRGTGPQGLTGIPPVRDGIIRPLLDTPRAAIDDYIAQNRLPYVTDETNLDTHYARNRLRLDIMPQLRAINPAAVTHITRTADILRAENDLLDAQAAALLPPEGTTLPCAALLSAPEALRPRMLRLLTDRLGAGKKDFTAAHYRALEDLCRTGGALSLPGGASAVCRDGALTLSDAPAPLDEAALRPGDNLAGLWRITLSDAPLTVLLFCIRALLHLYSRKLQKFFVRLNALGQELAVLEQRVGRHRGRYALCLLPAGDMNDLQRNTVRSRGFFHTRHPVVSKRALVGIIEDKAALFHRRVLGTGLEPRRLCILCKRQIHQIDPAFRCIGNGKSLICQILRVGEELPLPPLGRENAQPLSSLLLCVPDALSQQIIGISVPFQRAGDPQAVNIKIPVRLNRHPRVFCRNILNKALAALRAPAEDQPLFKALLEPLLFDDALLAGHRTADVLFLNIIIGDSDIVHRKNLPDIS